MISSELAHKLDRAGLVWQPRLHDFFWMPGRDFGDRLFVISDLQVYLELYQDWPMVTFHGSMEWALDYVMQSDVVWIPLEEQLREQLVARVDWLGLEFAGESYVCRIKIASEQHSFGASKWQ